MCLTCAVKTASNYKQTTHTNNNTRNYNYTQHHKDPDTTAQTISQALAAARSQGLSFPQFAGTLANTIDQGGASAAKAIAEAYARAVGAGDAPAAADTIAQGAAAGGTQSDAQAQAIAQVCAGGGGGGGLRVLFSRHRRCQHCPPKP